MSGGPLRPVPLRRAITGWLRVVVKASGRARGAGAGHIRRRSAPPAFDLPVAVGEDPRGACPYGGLL